MYFGVRVIDLVDRMRDCFGVEYALVRMPGNGLCGYSSLAYALTGQRSRYAEVIEDLCQAFFANPQLFIQRTLFGAVSYTHLTLPTNREV